MGLLGTGAVAIWHDIAPEGRDDFYANSSADQFTSFVCAMLWYARSPMARADEKAAASRAKREVVR